MRVKPRENRTLTAVLTATALNALTSRSLPPDEVTTAFDNMDVPFITEDTSEVAQTHTGLILWASAARKLGITRFRTVLIHPSLRFTVPKTAPSTLSTFATAPAAIIGERAGTSAVVVVPGAEGNTSAYGCAPVPYTPLGAHSAPEAIRHLRQIVLDGLRLVERDPSIATEFRNFPWRDWQEEVADSHAPSGFFALPAFEAATRAAVDIHEAMRPVLAPATAQPPEFGQLLAHLHQAAADVVTTATRDSANSNDS